MISRRRLEANASGPGFAAVSGLAFLKNKTRADFQTHKTGAHNLGRAQVNVGATRVDASPTKPPIPKNHRTVVKLGFSGLAVDVCLDRFRHCAARSAAGVAAFGALAC